MWSLQRYCKSLINRSVPFKSPQKFNFPSKSHKMFPNMTPFLNTQFIRIEKNISGN